MGPFVGGIEIICGALVIFGLFTRLAAILLLIDSPSQFFPQRFLSCSAFLGIFTCKTAALRIVQHIT